MSQDGSLQVVADFEDSASTDAGGAASELLARAWALRDDSPLEALRLTATVPGAGDPALAFRVHAVRAASLLALDDAEAAWAEVLDALAALESLVADGPQCDAPLVTRLARLTPAAIPSDLAAAVVETLLVGLRCACLTNELGTALPFGRAALTTATNFTLTQLCARAHNDIASVYGIRELDERAIEHLRAGIAVLEAADEPVTPALLNNLGNVYVSRDRLDEALACFVRARTGFGEAGDRLREGIAAANQGRALVAQRRFREGAGVLVEALRIFREVGRKSYVGATLAKLGTCYSEMGDHDGAQAWFEAALREFGADGLPFEGESRQAYGSALFASGRFEAALTEFELAETCIRREGAEASASGLLKQQARALAELGRYHEAYSRLSRYLERYDEFQAQRGESMLNVMLAELESGLAADHELPALTGRVLAEANRALRQQAERLERISTTDELTEQYNRRYLNRRLEDELRRASRGDQALSLILFDVDNFKAINDRHSHLVGDEVLRLVAATLRSKFRHNDVVARWGGEEFAVLLPQTGHAAALAVADKARAAVAEFDWSTVAADLAVTVSAGIVSSDEVTGSQQVTALLKLADSRLYRAKHAGRNRIAAS